MSFSKFFNSGRLNKQSAPSNCSTSKTAGGLPFGFTAAILAALICSGSIGCGSDSKPKANKYQPVTKFSNTQKDQLAIATKAKDELASTLMSELMASFMKHKANGSIEVCKSKAPEIAKKVGAEKNVKIGRTSFKIRNSNNRPPEWAKQFIDKKSPHTNHVALENDGLGVLFPIKINAFCLNCHGTKDKLAEGVAEQLAKLYPEDNATGFQDGDLRGYFWVEVPEQKESAK